MRRSLRLAAATVAAVAATTTAAATGLVTAPRAGAVETTLPGTTVTASQHGADPTADSIRRDGAYTVGQLRLAPLSRPGFYGGTVFYPTNGAPGERFAAVVTMPGFTEPGSAMNLVARRLASHGFVVLAAESMTWFDQPAARAAAAKGAMNALLAHPQASSYVDPSRTGLVGHSMGGGGVLLAASTMDVDGVIALHPWAQTTFGAETKPALVVGGGLDTIAPISQHAGPIYSSIGTREKGMLTELAGTHFAGLTDDAPIQSRNLSFMKVYLDGDARYVSFLCAGPAAGTTAVGSYGVCTR